MDVNLMEDYTELSVITLTWKQSNVTELMMMSVK